jgi:hypothetical protein
VALLPTAEIGPYWVDDVPPLTALIDFSDETGEPLNLNEYTSAAVVFALPDFTSVTLPATITALGALQVSLGSAVAFPLPGVYSLIAKFSDVGGVLLTAEPYQFVIQKLDGWITLEQARQQWQDAPVDDLSLYALLQSARQQCTAYARNLHAGEAVPVSWRQAQLKQTRALYMSDIANQNDSVGVDGFQVRIFPLDWNIKALLRTKAGLPVLG